MNARYAAATLTDAASALLVNSGLNDEKARAVAETLVEGDLMGHDTHGLALLGPYLAEIEKGAMTRDGEPLISHQRPAAQVWDGKRLPGPWLVQRAIAACAAMARTYGSGSVAIRRSHH